MLKIKSSVGKDGKNQARDLRIIQSALLQIELLSKQAYFEECLQECWQKPLDQFKLETVQGKSDPVDFMEMLEKGLFEVAESKIPMTIEAISFFQSNLKKAAKKPGFIAPKSEDLKQLIKSITEKSKVKEKGFGAEPYDLVLENGVIKVHISAESAQETKQIDVTKSRNFILQNYNWNGIIKLMQFVFEKYKDEYLSPVSLNGTAADNEKIIPDEGIIYLIKCQLDKAIKDKGLTAAALPEILRQADGLPGSGFFKNIIKKQKEQFFTEVNNKIWTDFTTGEKLMIPKLNDGEAALYDFFKNIVFSKNGLWSDQPGVVNLIGLRRVLDKKINTHYNDTIAQCWLEKQGEERIKRVELDTATTEPGNRVKYRQLMPQTVTLVPGYHFIRQPAGRTQNAIKQESDEGTFTWCKGDTTMNFHQGGNSFVFPGSTPKGKKYWLSNHGFGNIQTGTPSTNWDEKALLDLNLILSEIYLILSRYGIDKTQSSYKNLLGLANAPALKNEGLKDGKITVSQGSKKTIVEIDAVREWLVNYWFRKRSKAEREKFTEILDELDILDKKTMANWENLDKALVKQEITDNHIIQIVNFQMRYFPELKEIDGKAGQLFVKALRGIRQSTDEAKLDKIRVDHLFETLGNFPITGVKILIKKLKEQLLIHTDNNRENLLDNIQYIESEDTVVIQNKTVGAYSAGCQVIYDTEVFYTFWTNLLAKAAKVGQVRWYYTLVDITHIKNTDIV